NETTGQPKPNRSSEIREGDHVAVNENTRAEQMEKMIDPVAMGCVMIVVLPLHHLSVKARQRLRDLHQTSCHFANQTTAHNFLPFWIFPGGRPPAITLHRLRRAKQLFFQRAVIFSSKI